MIRHNFDVTAPHKNETSAKVVYCKNCKHSCMVYGLRHCSIHKAAAGYWTPVADKYFCADGEEK